MEHSRVCCLYRVSTDKQVDYDSNHEADIPMQRKACHRFAEKMGWNILYEEQEDGVSGHKVRAADRDKIQIIKELARKKAFDILLVFMFDRIGRIADETPFVVEWFVKNGIQVWSTQEGEQRFDNHIDKLLNYIRFWQADGESEKTSIRTRTSLGQMVEGGHFKGGSPAVGYELVKSGRLNKKRHELYDLKVKESDAEIVRIIFRKYVYEGYGVQKIADYLNEHGYPHPRESRWSRNTIRNILQNETYVGILRSGDSRSPAIPELQIIPQELFDRAQEIRHQRAAAKENEPRVPLNMRGHSLLSGNIFCGHCGSRLHLTTSNRYYYPKNADSVTTTKRIRYVCYKKVRKLSDCCGQSGYSAAKLDSVVEAVIRDVFSRIKAVPKSEFVSARFEKELESRKSNLAALRSELLKEQDKSRKLREEVIRAIQGESAFLKEMLSELVNECEEKVRSLSESCAQVTDEIESKEQMVLELSRSYDELISWSELFDSASLEAKKMIVNAMCKRIEVSRGYNIHIEFNFNLRQFFLGLENGPDPEQKTA